MKVFTAVDQGQTFREKAIILLFPWLLIGFFVSNGLGSHHSNTFGGLLLALGLWQLIALRGEVRAPKVIKRTYWVGFVLVAMVTVHALVGQNLEMLFQFQFANLRNLIILPLFAVLLAVVRFDAQMVWKLIVAAGLYTVFLSLMMAIEGGPRGKGVVDEVIVVGNLGVLFSLLALMALLGLKSRLWQALALLVFAAGISVSVLSQTRTGWVAIVVAMVLLLWGVYSINRKYFVGMLVAFAVVILSIVLFWDALPIEARVMQAVNDVIGYFEHGNANTSVGARLDMWYVGLHAFWEKPVFGWGVVPYKETFVAAIESGVSQFQLKGDSDGYAQPHNDYVFMLYHFGLFGFLTAMTMILIPVIYLFKIMIAAKKEHNHQLIFLALTGLVAIEALLDFMMFNLALNNEIFYVVMVVVFMVVFAIEQDKRQNA